MLSGGVRSAETSRIDPPHHLLDLAEPSERFTVARFQEEGRVVLRRVERPLLVGGSGLYARAVVDDLAFPPEDPAVRAALESEADDLGVEELFHRLAETDPVAAARIEPGNVRRIIRALELGSFDDLVRWAATAGPSQIAGLAPAVLDAAQEGNAACGALVRDAARELAALVAALTRYFPAGVPVGVAATGGLLGEVSPLREALHEELHAAAPLAGLRAGSLDPALAAARLAASG